MGSPWTGHEADLNRRLREVVRRQDGIVTLDQLFRLGLSPTMIRSRVRSGRLVPVLKRAFTLPGSRLGERGRWRAAVESAGRGTFLSHASSLALHGLARDYAPIHLVSLSGAFRGRASREVLSSEEDFRVELHQTRRLPDEHVTEVGGIRATTVERALLDFAATAGEVAIVKALSQGERERKIRWDALGQILTSTRGHRGAGRLRREVERWDPSFAEARSDPEEDFLLMIRRHGLPMPMVNVPVGPFVADFFWRSLDLVVELDPWGTHRGRESFHRDHRKSVELEARGLRVIRFTWEDLYRHEARTARELAKIIESQAPRN